MLRKRAKKSDNSLEEMALNFKPSRTIIATKLKSINCSSGNSSRNHGSKIAQKPSKWCPHCKCCLSIKTFYKHKSLYFISNKWITTEELPATESFASTSTTTGI